MSLCRSSRLLLARFPATPIVRIPSAIRHNTTTTTPAQRTSASPSPATNSAAVTSSSESETPTDSVTNAFSPVTTFPQDHDSNKVIAAAIISGAPIDLQSRTVRIYKPAKPATQSGNWNGRQWRMDWDVLPKGHRWENPLMGWQSSGDYMQGTHIFFKTKEDAIRFAEKQGYDWFVQEPKVREFRVKSYAANFLHSPNKLKVIRTK